MMTVSSFERQLDPFPIYKEMRASSPVYLDPERGTWNVFRYDDVQRVLSDYETFSSQFQRDRAAETDMPLAASMISTDPPRHRQAPISTRSFSGEPNGRAMT